MSSIERLNTVSKSYSGNQTFPANNRRGYFLIVMTSGEGTIEFGEGGGKLPLPAEGFYEPAVTPLGEITVETTGTFVVHEG